MPSLPILSVKDGQPPVLKPPPPQQQRILKTLEYIVLAPPCLLDASVVLAAGRAGALGVVDLEFASAGAAGVAESLIARAGTGDRLGVRVATSDDATRALLGRLPNGATVILSTIDELSALAEDLQSLRGRQVKVLVEVRSGEEATVAERFGVDGLIARGMECGGWGGDETTFILLQRLVSVASVPVWAQGGIGEHTVAACHVAGAAGVVLDVQVALARESALPPAVRAAIGRMDGSETVCLGEELGLPFRVFARPGLRVLEELRDVARRLHGDARTLAERRAEWRATVGSRVGWGDPDRDLWVVGQDAAFASRLAQRFGTVGGVIEGLRAAAVAHAEAASRNRVLAADAPLARIHGTKYPILQGPMTRVSDVSAFAAAVAEGGALPFLALALLRGPEVRVLLEETARLLGDRPWGVGILGFVPLELRQEQLAMVREVRPKFALIAGGRPDQALALEREGISTYLHVPSPGMLRLFLENGARRFVFEGRECGGHVGPRSSFVLWNTMVDVLLDAGLAEGEAEKCHVVFAGGIHDARSAAMVAAVSAPLAARGMKVGVLLGTGYLFTREAVATGAIQPAFQDEARQCTGTVLLETGPGHATRCAVSPFTEVFERERARLIAEGHAAEEIRQTLEELNLGRLRIASKGVKHNPSAPTAGPRNVVVDLDEQRRDGMYMIGQLATLRREVVSVAELHDDVSHGSLVHLDRLTADPSPKAEPLPVPSDVAIIGLACMLPKAPDLETYWANILNKVDAIIEVPEDRFDWRKYFDPDPKARDKIYSKWGGFLDSVEFDTSRYGIPPASLTSIEPVQLMVVEAVSRALADGGYATREFPRQRTGVVVGVGGGIGDLGYQYAVRAALPTFVPEAPSEVWNRLPEWTEDSFAGIIANVTAGRVANRFNLRGVNFTVDAACASSLAALYAGVRELEVGAADMMVVAAADTIQNPFGYLCFSKTHALSPRGRCRAFDDSADGTVISEGIAVVVLKRLADAERDGDRIYAVIKAVEGASDGRGLSLTAPSPDGQVLALERAYRKAGFSPATVGLIEAHGTGTVAGDQAEIAALSRAFAGADTGTCAVGSVKSMIGHTKCAAGLAGLIKVAKALHHGVLPPTIGVDRPNRHAGFEAGPFYVSSELRPWVQVGHKPRRAGVSAFGFGGTNFHVALEEHQDPLPCHRPYATTRAWPAELVLAVGRTGADIVAAIDRLAALLPHASPDGLTRVAATAWEYARAERVGLADETRTLAVVATSIDDLRDKLALARQRIVSADVSIEESRGVYYSTKPLASEGGVAFVFPGQGSQYPNMLRDLSVHFDEVRQAFERASNVLADRLPQPLASYVFPPPHFTAEMAQARQEALQATRIAQPSIGAADVALCRLLAACGVVPEVAAGHSYGEYVALWAAGALDEDALYAVSEARGRAIAESAVGDLGTMAAITASRQAVATGLQGLEGVWIANENAPLQTVISGTRLGIDAALSRLGANGLNGRKIPVSCAFHSPLMESARRSFGAVLETTELRSPQMTVFSNTLAAPFAADPSTIRSILVEHLVQPVRFVDEVEAMYAAGSRLFVEVGPSNVLTGLVRQSLEGRPFLAVASDVANRSGLVQLLHLLGRLGSQGVPVSLDRLFRDRLVDAETTQRTAAAMWLVSGAGVRPKSATTVSDRRVVGTGKRVDPPPHSAKREEVHVSSTVGPLPARTENGVAAMTGTATSASDEVMVQFQRTMSRFLEVQRNVMLSYLGQSATTAPEVGVQENAMPPTRPVAMPQIEVERAPERDHVPTVQTVPTPGESPALDAAWLRETLLTITSERTGYPLDMLDLDANMEADLGIDSIKRVEILGALQAALPEDVARELGDALETLTRAKTLRTILQSVSLGPIVAADPAPRLNGAGPALNGSRAVDGEGAASVAILAHETTDGDHVGHQGGMANGHAPDDSSARTVASGRVPRCVLAPVELPRVSSAALRLPRDVIVIVEDDDGKVASAVARALHSAEARIVRVAHGEESIQRGSTTYKVPLADPDAVARLMTTIRLDHGPIGGLMHLASLTRAGGPTLDASALVRRRIERNVKGLFHLLRAAAVDLSTADQGFVLAVTALGGTFGCDGMPLECFAPDGGVAGLVKTVAIEWPATRCKVVDVELFASVDDVVASVVGELTGADQEVEVGIREGRRFALRVRPERNTEAMELSLNSNAVVLITGGVRGITSLVAEELGRRSQGTLILVGRQPEPEPTESAVTAALTDERQIKAALIADVRQQGQTPRPSEVDAVYRRLLRDRETRRRLEAIRRTGARIEYRQVDLCDEDACATLVRDIYVSFGRLDGVVHGAGMIEDKLIAEKSSESFARVFDTKVTSALVLARVLDPSSLAFFVLFSSVTARWGNRGQADYAAANEILNKVAAQLNASWPGRVVALNWGPWAGSGMVSDAVARQFAERGVDLVPPAAGVLSCLDEIVSTRSNAEVVLGGGPWLKGVPAAPSVANEVITLCDPFVSDLEHAVASPEVVSADLGALPLLTSAAARLGPGGSLELTEIFDTARHLYLHHHVLDGKPVVPAAIAAEFMAEAVQQAWPDWMVVGLTGFRVLHGVVLGDGPKELRLVARSQAHAPDAGLEMQVDVELFEAGRVKPSYRAVVDLAQRFPEPLAVSPLDAVLRPFSMPMKELYREWLFHGPSLQCISAVHGIAEGWVVGELQPSRPVDSVVGAHGSRWLLDPVLLDGGLQLVLLYMRATWDVSALPAGFAAVRRYAPIPDGRITARLQVRAGSSANAARFDVLFLAGDSRVVLAIEGLEATGSRTLNRLMGWSGPLSPMIATEALELTTPVATPASLTK